MFGSQGDESGDDGERSFPWEEFLNGWLCVLDPSLMAIESAPEDKHGPLTPKKSILSVHNLLSYCQGLGREVKSTLESQKFERNGSGEYPLPREAPG